MSQDIILIRVDADCHQEETILFLASEEELSQQEVDQIEYHTRGCRLCQTRLVELEQGFAVYEEFRKTVLLPEVKPEPHRFREFPARLRFNHPLVL